MDPLWVLLSEGWWALPAAVTAVGAGAIGTLGVRAQRRAKVRRLELHAAQGDVRSARTALTRSRAAVHAARAHVARVEADRRAGRAGTADVAAARQGMRQAQSEATAASAALIARRADVRAARVSMPTRRDGADALPLARLMAAHSAVTTAWMAYETDPALTIAYPSMSDARAPLTATFLREQQAAQWLRPSSAEARISPADYAAYRDAVRRMSQAFDAAERDAWRRAGDPRGQEPPSEWWVGLAQELSDGASRTVAWSIDAMARVAALAPRSTRRDPRPPRS
ncbi:hypothetical protein NQ152_04120 [Microbacterium sp. zg.B48]|uniref:hypothetical protein n=1 Tax=Microbacterium sp. zg.B48 TaxID=2969408 RepID=UPI00214B5859|nr:hypothetical protein [Microbacterium sp. zg.B48]MCR2762691.1 hypothetical protein [Microbacterium sp. zg.B48]